jgi:GNAT superfamily N-acetyltransferase
MSMATTTALAAAVRDACATAAVDAYEDAGMQGLCAEGRFEAAVGAIERVDVTAIVAERAQAGDAVLAPAGLPMHSPVDPANIVQPALLIRPAAREDLPAIVALLADDVSGARPGRPGRSLTDGCLAAFEAIERAPDCELLVACHGARVVGTMQLDFTPVLSRQGAWCATIEALRVAAAERSQDSGRTLIEWAIARARARGCHVVRLGADCLRADAHSMYERFGFVASLPGMRLELPGPG